MEIWAVLIVVLAWAFSISHRWSSTDALFKKITENPMNTLYEEMRLKKLVQIPAYRMWETWLTFLSLIILIILTDRKKVSLLTATWIADTLICWCISVFLFIRLYAGRVVEKIKNPPQ